jgi:hypothetical protein
MAMCYHGLATSPGEYLSSVGLYDRLTGKRVRVSGQDANACGDTVCLGTVRVVAPAASAGVEGEKP